MHANVLDTHCSLCAKPLVSPMLLSCGHSTVCRKCAEANKSVKCAVCSARCKKRKRCTNLTLNRALRVLCHDLYGDEACDKAEARSMLLCAVCEQVLLQPAVHTACGHSPTCYTCFHDGSRNKCMTCGQHTTPGGTKPNHTLDQLLQDLLPREFVGRDRVSPSTYLQDREEQQCAELSAMYGLGEQYSRRAFDVIGRHFAQKGSGQTELIVKCHCDLVCLPRYSNKHKSYFFGCPAWKPTSHKLDKGETGGPGSSCKMFKFASGKQAAGLAGV
jgi:hypothetical protein